MFSDEEWQDYVEWHRRKYASNPREWFRAVLQMERAYRFGWLLELLTQYGGGDMARGRGSKPQGKANGSAGWTQFVDISMAGHEWSDVVQAFGSSEQIDGGLAILLEKGYRVGFSYNPANDAVICSITCRDEESPNSGKTFNAFAGTWVEALQVALYKHYIVTKTVWGGDGAGAARPAFG